MQIFLNKLLRDEYNLVGYGAVQLSYGDGKVKFGEFEVPLYQGPVYVREFEPGKNTPLKIKINIERPNTEIEPKRPYPSSELDRQLKPVLNLLEREEKIGSKAKKQLL